MKVLIVVLLVVCAVVPASAGDSPSTYIIGALAIRGDKLAIQRWQPTVDYLSKETAINFTLRTLTLDEIDQAVKSKQVHFILTNPANYVVLQKRHGLSAIASFTYYVESDGVVHETNKFSAVIFSSKSNGINSIAELSGKTFGAVHKNAFGGWWMAWKELLDHDIDPHKHLKEIRFYNFPQDQVVFAVLNGEVDAGTVRSGVLESLSDSGLIDLSRINILASHQFREFPLLHSTKLYPEWAISVVPGVDNEISRKLVKTLFSIPKNHSTLQSARISAWTVPPDYMPVHGLMEQLNVGQYAETQDFTIKDIFNKYWEFIVATILLMVGYLVFLLISSNRANILLKHGKDSATLAYNKYKEANNHLETIIQFKSRLLTSLNNELKAPLNAILCFLHPVKDTITTRHPEIQYAVDGIENASFELKSVIYDITDTLEIHDFNEKPTFTSVSIRKMLEELTQSFSVAFSINNNEFSSNLSREIENIVTDPVLLNKLIFNLLHNANKHTRHGKISLEAAIVQSDEKNIIEISVIDNGRGLQKSFLEQLLSANDTLIKPDLDSNQNIGGGLYCCKKICEALHGTIYINSNPYEGTEVRVQLPTLQELELLAS